MLAPVFDEREIGIRYGYCGGHKFGLARCVNDSIVHRQKKFVIPGSVGWMFRDASVSTYGRQSILRCTCYKIQEKNTYRFYTIGVNIAVTLSCRYLTSRN